MRVLIVGEGSALVFLCRRFLERGWHLIVINRVPEECLQLARQLTATVVCGDGSDARTLEEAGALGADVVLAITPRDQDNLVACQLASLKFRVPRAVALANDPSNAAAFSELGVTSFSTAEIVASLIEERTALENIINLLPLGEGRVRVTEVALDVASPVLGRPLKDIDLPANSLVAVVIRDGRAIVPRGSATFLNGDRLVLVTTPENHGSVLRTITGDGR